MPTKAGFRFTLMMIVGTMMASILVRQWAARHATHDGPDAVVADAIQATF
jgi:hypothetical protein